MSFEESVIVPLSVFKKCNFSQQGEEETESDPHKNILKEDETPKNILDETPKNILNDTTLPPDVKIKLHHQKKRLGKRVAKEPQLVTIKSNSAGPPPDEDYILSQFALKLKPCTLSLNI